MKTCTKCKIEKELSCFSKAKEGKNGLRAACKNCAKIYNNSWRLNNQQQIKDYTKYYYNTEQGKLAAKRSYEKNYEKALKRNRIARRTEHARNLANIARRTKYKNDPSFRLAIN